ncbi:pyroglutamyl-peptidase 1 [Agrilus planipennis]|uniref:Pyroglutamyl-peptidase 1 n=1 Tax=Agrilus planipennis TaxID=224129 RepID=A0A1W4X8V3_AGRPL|nr:pyroglutamyl-peptidase 1 [Agrilus planipennis]XP_018332536.1 pyroglutamyl-peptidase 1 [Agrilus planipennis]
MPSEIILITGFGPFKDHKVNASWEAVKELRTIAELKHLIIHEIAVEYNHVDVVVPMLWKKYDPKLVIHVGVSSIANKITLETCAFRNGYNRLDCKGNTLKNGECANEKGTDVIFTELNTQEICNAINNQGKLKSCVSKNAGRYLCEYTFYKSLTIDKERTLFVHVPPLNSPYNERELAEGLLLILQKALEQLETKDNEV